VSLSIPTTNLPATGTGTVATQSGVTLLNTWGIEPGVPVVRPLHVTQSFSIGGATVTPRRVVVDAMQTCRTCHMRFSKHGPTGRNNPQLCVLCHNPNNTDVSHAARQGRLGEYDGKKEESKDFKRMIHAIHGSAKRALCVDDDEPCKPGYQLRAIAFSMPSKLAEKTLTTATLTARTSHFPTGRSVGNCNSCHVNNSYELSRTNGGLKTRGVIGSTYSTGDHPAGDIPDPATGLAAGMNLLSNHKKFSPVMSVCSACHTTRLSRNHMLQMGGSDQASIDNRDPNAESCGLCHGPGAVAGLEVVHPVK
jgi:OmcA/MtrC family decaheme c-type cytochrome